MQIVQRSTTHANNLKSNQFWLLLLATEHFERILSCRQNRNRDVGWDVRFLCQFYRCSKSSFVTIRFNWRTKHNLTTLTFLWSRAHLSMQSLCVCCVNARNYVWRKYNRIDLHQCGCQDIDLSWEIECRWMLQHCNELNAEFTWLYLSDYHDETKTHFEKRLLLNWWWM